MQYIDENGISFARRLFAFLKSRRLKLAVYFDSALLSAARLCCTAVKFKLGRPTPSSSYDRIKEKSMASSQLQAECTHFIVTNHDRERRRKSIRCQCAHLITIHSRRCTIVKLFNEKRRIGNFLFSKIGRFDDRTSWCSTTHQNTASSPTNLWPFSVNVHAICIYTKVWEKKYRNFRCALI